ncbi:hypothetical protein C5167_043370 [Papaver somniferum]|uniref:Transcription repressor n=1 Tax=Papaver somniferum TaxID=3469 RepID=A0A4Y7L9F4_PAPSO|nr:transcription repressor OFP12-like [Papaver somniferum]RZC80795.1 hypothetical protein C5167_043370 [Papaver somniferum]
MPRTLSKTIHHYFSKLKRQTTSEDHHQNPTKATATTTTPNQTQDEQILIKKNSYPNKPSFYDILSAPKSLTPTPTTSTHDFSSSDHSDTETSAAAPDFATVFNSRRFFFSSPGQSNSIIDSGRFSSNESVKCSQPESGSLIISRGIPIQTYSPDPYMDFRRSMQEMVEATEFSDVRADWNYLHELLLCYLALNPKHTHKFIMDAFADLLVCLMTSSTAPSTPTSNIRFHGVRRLL